MLSTNAEEQAARYFASVPFLDRSCRNAIESTVSNHYLSSNLSPVTEICNREEGGISAISGHPRASPLVVSLLQDLGWLINYKKSVLYPTQKLEHLDFFVLLKTRDMIALLSPVKLLPNIRRSTKQVLERPHPQPGSTYTSSDICNLSGSLLVQATPTIIQESGRETKFGLESRSTTGLGKSERVTVEVLPQYSDVEWSLVTSINAQSNNVRRR
ncbi:hypothetical protein G6F42_015782 [Rhizopus arrhizus]|nr:hypothetical protein G6F42_015782 [Rhizopus arrhizus]